MSRGEALSIVHRGRIASPVDETKGRIENNFRPSWIECTEVTPTCNLHIVSNLIRHLTVVAIPPRIGICFVSFWPHNRVVRPNFPRLKSMLSLNWKHANVKLLFGYFACTQRSHIFVECIINFTGKSHKKHKYNKKNLISAYTELNKWYCLS